MKRIYNLILVAVIFSMTYASQIVFATPFFSNGYFTKNGIEWCEENKPLYEILGKEFFEHHKHSIESRICANLFNDYFWKYEGPGRIEKLIERSNHYYRLEIAESFEESEIGIIDTEPAENKDQTLLQGITGDGQMTVQIISSAPTKNQSMEFNLAFMDKEKRLVPQVNYGIKISQEGEMILENEALYSDRGLATLITRPLDSGVPVKIQVEINGIGPMDTPEVWSEPNGEVLMFTVVPEFGTVAIIILIFTLSITVIFTQNKKLFFRIS